MTTYYVDPLGTNDGAHGTAPGAGAWQTLTYALGTSGVPLTGGPHTVMVAAGTYSEGAGGLTIGRAYGTLTTVTGNTTTPSSVVVQSATTNALTALVFNATTNLRLEGLQFQANGTPVSGTFMCRMNAATTNIQFADCRFVLPNQANTYAFSTGGGTAGASATDLLFERCTVVANVAATQSGIFVEGNASYTPNRITVRDCTINAGQYALSVSNSTNVVMTGNKVTCTGALCLSFNRDGATATARGSAVISNNTLLGTGASTHPLLIGPPSDDVVLSNNVAVGITAMYALVDKGTRTVARDNLFVGGTRNAYYLKSCTGHIGRRNTCIATTAGSYGIETSDTGGSTVTGSDIKDCAVVAMPGAVCFLWAGHDSTDAVKLLSYWGDIGTTLPSNGYGTPANTIGPTIPLQNSWTLT